MSRTVRQCRFMRPSGNSNDGISPPGPFAAGVTMFPAGEFCGKADGGPAVAAAMTTFPEYVGDCDALGIHFSIDSTGTLVGTLTLQGSCHRGDYEQNGQPGANLSSAENWVTLQFFDEAGAALAASKAVASGANAFIFSLRNVTFRWVRLVFAFTSGTAQPKISLQAKGAA